MHTKTARTILPFLAAHASNSPFGRSTVHFQPDKAGDGSGEGGAPAGGAPPANGAPAGGSSSQQQPPKGGESGDGKGGDGKGNPGQFEPGWLNDRIAQAKRAAQQELLQQLGIQDPEEAKKVVTEGKKALDASKTDLERKDDEIKALRAVAGEAKTLREKLTARADAELAALPEAARERVKALAGDDPVKLLDAIDLARAMSGGSQQQQSTTGQQGASSAPAGAPAQGGKPPVPPAANTTGAAGGPPSAPGSPTDHLAVWRDMQGKNPLAAAHYYLANQAAIVEQQQKTANQ